MWLSVTLLRQKSKFLELRYPCHSLLFGSSHSSWFCGPIKRGEAERVLKIHKVRGMFMVRESTSKPGDYSLSLHDGQNVKHYHIRQLDEGGHFFITCRTVFKSIIDLVDHYSKNSDGLAATLSTPCPRLYKPRTDLSHNIRDGQEISRDSITFVRQIGSGSFSEVWEGKYNKTTPWPLRCSKQGLFSHSYS